VGGPRRRRQHDGARPPGRPARPGLTTRPGQGRVVRRVSRPAQAKPVQGRPAQARPAQGRPAQSGAPQQAATPTASGLRRRPGVTRLAGEAPRTDEISQLDPNQVEPLTVGWFSSGGGEGSMGMLEAAVDAIELGDLNARIEFLFCNRDRGQRIATDKFLDYAAAHAIEVRTVSSYEFRKARSLVPWEELREMFDEEAMKKLAGFDPKITIAAGYMLIAPLLCERFKMINVHPALPGGPIGTWQEVTWELIDRKDKESGVMTNIATKEVDAGPVLSYCRYPVVGGELDWMWFRAREEAAASIKEREGERNTLFMALRELGLPRERPLLVETLKAIISGEINLNNPAVTGPIDLTMPVEMALAPDDDV